MKEAATYLNFDGNCREAMQFYEKCFGGELILMPFSQSPGSIPPETKDRVMHARLSINSKPLLMASDSMPGAGAPLVTGNNFSIMVPCESAGEVDKLFAALSEKGHVIMPVNETFWAARFGMVTDQFGINWMLNFEKAA